MISGDAIELLRIYLGSMKSHAGFDFCHFAGGRTAAERTAFMFGQIR